MFKGLGNLSNLGAIMKQAQEFGTRMQAIQNELRAKRVSGAAGGGLVEVEANGLSEVLSVRIDPTLIEKGDREMLEDLLPAAINAAQQKAKQLHAESVQSLTGGLAIPGIEEMLSQLSGNSDGPGAP